MKKNHILIAAFFAAVLMQLYIPLKTIIVNETMISKNRIYKFRVISADPNDAFRGKYLNMRLANNRFITDKELKEGDAAYVTIAEDQSGYAVITEFYNDKSKIPKDTEYMKVMIRWVSRETDKGWSVAVDYPFERYYINEKLSYEIQKAFNRYYNECIAEVSVGNGNAVLLRVTLKGEPIEKYAKNNPEKELTRDEVLKEGKQLKLRVKPLRVSANTNIEYEDFVLPLKSQNLKSGDIVYVKFKKDKAGFDVPEDMDNKETAGSEMMRVHKLVRGKIIFKPVENASFCIRDKGQGDNRLFDYVQNMERKKATALVRVKGPKVEIEQLFIEGTEAGKYAELIMKKNIEDYKNALKNGVYYKLHIIGAEEDFPGDDELFVSTAVNGTAVVCSDFDNSNYDYHDLYHIPLKKLDNGFAAAGTPVTCKPVSGHFLKGYIYRDDETHTMFVIEDNIMYKDALYSWLKEYDTGIKILRYLTIVMTQKEIFLVNITEEDKVVYEFYK